MAARLFRESHATVIVFEEFAGRFGIVRDSMKLAGKEKSTAETESTHKSKTAAVAVLRPCAGMAGETGQLLQRRDSFDTTRVSVVSMNATGMRRIREVAGVPANLEMRLLLAVLLCCAAFIEGCNTQSCGTAPGTRRWSHRLA